MNTNPLTTQPKSNRKEVMPLDYCGVKLSQLATKYRFSKRGALRVQ